MTETRIIVCEECGGDGGFEMLGPGCDPNTGAPMTYWEECEVCQGKREIEQEVEPITLEDLDEAGA
jgi:hypothetical protein